MSVQKPRSREVNGPPKGNHKTHSFHPQKAIVCSLSWLDVPSLWELVNYSDRRVYLMRLSFKLSTLHNRRAEGVVSKRLIHLLLKCQRYCSKLY